MSDSPHVLKARLTWVKTYQATGNASLTCRRCGISRPTLRKWWLRYQADGLKGLHSRSRRRKQLPDRQLQPDEEAEILRLRRDRNLGPKRIQAQMLRTGWPKRSTSTIWKVLHRNNGPPLRRPRRKRAAKRYECAVPGQRVQIDNFKVHNGLYQFTAIDDCTRLRVVGLYPDRSAQSAACFMEDRVLVEFPFPIQRVQTDRGAEFCSEAFTEVLRRHAVKFRPNRPRAPHLNGKVERSQQTDQVEFWALVEVNDPGLEAKLATWQRFYNEDRPHGGIGGRTPSERLHARSAQVPSVAEVRQAYDADEERYRVRPYKRKKWLRL